MKLTIFALSSMLILFGSLVFAKGDLTKQTPEVQKINLGSKSGQLAYFPNHLEFETGKLYKLVIHNPSPQKHYLAAPGLAGAVFTRKVEVKGDHGEMIGEIKGVISEIELGPGGTAEWYFVPVKTGTRMELSCSIAGHKEGGMTGTVTIR